MVKAVLLLRMIGFTSLFVAWALAILAYQKSPRRWLKFLLIYMGIEAVYSVSFTFIFYSNIYLSAAPRNPGNLFILFQILSSIGILYAAPRFLQELLCKKRGLAARRGILIMPTLFVLAAFVAVSEVAPGIESRISSLFYLYLFLFYLWALFHRKELLQSRWRKPLQVLIIAAVAWHLLWAVELSFFRFSLSPEGPLPSILLTNALWEVLWAVVVLFPAILEIKQPAQGAAVYSVPPEFKKEYGISNREAEIIPRICSGESNKAIAESLCISPRTVENHVQNTYRKCGISRRIELVHLLSRY